MVIAIREKRHTRKPGYESRIMAEEVEFVSDEDVPEMTKRRESERGKVHSVDYKLVYPLYER